MNNSSRYFIIVPLLGLIAVFQTVVGPRLTLINVRPNLVLLTVIVGTLLYGSREGIVWAFAGGLWMDVFSGGPMGGSSLALMVAALVAGVGHNTLFRSNLLVPVLASILGTLGYSLAYLGILAAIGHRLPFAMTVERLVVPVIIYNGALMLLATPLLNRVPEQRDVG